MPLPLATAIAIYITIWWITLFAVLPLGVRSTHEDGGIHPAGVDPGAPVAPRLLVKAALTTAVSTVLFAGLMIAIRMME